MSSVLYFRVTAVKLRWSPTKMIGVLPSLYAQSTFGTCLALKLLLKGAGQFPDTIRKLVFTTCRIDNQFRGIHKARV